MPCFRHSLNGSPITCLVVTAIFSAVARTSRFSLAEDWKPDPPATGLATDPQTQFYCTQDWQCGDQYCAECYGFACNTGSFNGNKCVLASYRGGVCYNGGCVECFRNSDCSKNGCSYCDRSTNTCSDYGPTQTCTPPVGDAGYCSDGSCKVSEGCTYAYDCFSTEPSGAIECAYCAPSGCQNFRTNGAVCTSLEVTNGTCSAGVCIAKDTEEAGLTGFDGERLTFELLGNHTLLRDGDGWQVDLTFSPVPHHEETARTDDTIKSLPIAVTVLNPWGEQVTCSLPAISPNSTALRVYGVVEGELMEARPPGVQQLSFGDMSASAIAAWTNPAGGAQPRVVGCHINTTAVELQVTQTFGWQAVRTPAESSWAAPLTWVGVHVSVLEPMAPPLTGALVDLFPDQAPALAPQAPAAEIWRTQAFSVVGLA